MAFRRTQKNCETIEPACRTLTRWSRTERKHFLSCNKRHSSRAAVNLSLVKHMIRSVYAWRKVCGSRAPVKTKISFFFLRFPSHFLAYANIRTDVYTRTEQTHKFLSFAFNIPEKMLFNISVDIIWSGSEREANKQTNKQAVIIMTVLHIKNDQQKGKECGTWKWTCFP